MRNQKISLPGFKFSFNPTACERCAGACCRGESGNVWIYPNDIEKISDFLKIYPVDFIADNLDKKDNRYRLKEKFAAGEYICTFFNLGKKRCDIYPVRPQQCRRYPFWDDFKKNTDLVLEECPGAEIEKDPNKADK